MSVRLEQLLAAIESDLNSLDPGVHGEDLKAATDYALADLQAVREEIAERDRLLLDMGEALTFQRQAYGHLWSIDEVVDNGELLARLDALGKNTA